MNDSPKSSASLLWETSKAVLRGKIISFSVHKKKTEKQEENRLEEKKIRELEILHANNPTDVIYNELRKQKFLLNEINKISQFLIHRLRQETYHHNNKSSKYLANQIKRNREKVTIATIKDSTGKPTNSPQEINTIFRNFYAKLYSSDNNTRQEDINSFFNNIQLPKLNTEQISARAGS